jgi:hypothetical protein
MGSWTLTWISTLNQAEGGVAQAEAALEAALVAGETYINIHATGNPGGEIRGFLSAVPKPSTRAMMLLGFADLGFAFRRTVRI